MSQILYALVVLQGTTLSFSPGYTTAAECLVQYYGPNVSCFAYDPNLSTWTAFFKLPEGDLGQLARFPARTSVSDTSVRLRTVSPPLAGSWLCPSLVTLPALPQCRLRQRPHQRRNLWSLTRLRLCRWRLRQTQQASTPNPATYRSAASNTRR
jgi:hypothetical protein